MHYLAIGVGADCGSAKSNESARGEDVEHKWGQSFHAVVKLACFSNLKLTM